MVKKKRIVILGAGFAGLRAFYHLNRLRDIDIVLVDPRDTSLVRPLLPEIALAGTTVSHARIPLRPLIEHHGGEFVHGGVSAVDAKEAQLTLSDGRRMAYDYLFVAVGARKDYDAIPGYRAHGYSVCDDIEAPRLYERLRRFEGGRVVIGSARSSWGSRVTAPDLAAPCEGPIIEIMFMLDHELRRRGLHEGSTIRVFSPGKIFVEDVGPRVHADFEPLIKASGIQVETSKVLRAIHVDHVEFEDGATWETDLAVVIPPYAAHAFVKDSVGLGDEQGFIPTDQTMRHLDFDNIYAAGDGTALAMPKLGHIAVHQADVGAAALRRAITGQGEIPSYRPEVFCIANRGGGEATLILSDALFGGAVDLTLGGPIAHLFKWSFDSYYFHTHGHMPPDALTNGMEQLLVRAFNDPRASPR
jgi:sulfide:quinone oxidoreductase